MGHHPWNYCLTTRLLLFSQEDMLIAINILFFVSPYYMVNDGISQVNNYGGIQPKTRVKQKIIFLLHKYNRCYIPESSTSFHLGGPCEHIRCFRVPFLRTISVTRRIRNIWYNFRKWLRYQPHKTYLRGK